MKNLNLIQIYFGNADDHLRGSASADFAPYEALLQKLKVESLVFLKQTHSADVFCAHSISNPLTVFQHEGDAIITNQKNIGIGVITADCLPIIFHDPKNNAIGVAHAGWKGLQQKIITATIKKMQHHFQTNTDDLKIYFGPSARECCYEVQNDFLPHFSDRAMEKLIVERDGKLFFNAQACAINELKSAGFKNKIDLNNNACTICTPGFCSVRKEKNTPKRQASVVSILFDSQSGF